MLRKSRLYKYNSATGFFLFKKWKCSRGWMTHLSKDPFEIALSMNDYE